MFEPLARLEVWMFEPLARHEVWMFEPLARLEVWMFEPLARLEVRAALGAGGGGGRTLDTRRGTRYARAVITKASRAPAPTPPLARTQDEWREAVRARGERPFVGDQVWDWIHKKGVVDPAKMTNLPARAREALRDEGLGEVLRVRTLHASTDGSRKLTLELRDGATIETVLLPRVTDAPPSASEHELLAASEAEGAGVEDDDDETLTGARSPSGIAAGASASAQVPGVRVTQCISTQVGCAMGCTFCASGVAGLKRHLGPDEIVAQVLLGRSLLRAGDEATPPEVLRNVVYMGMGEPLHNYEATARSLRLLTQRGGIGLSTRRVTVSTSGLVPEIRRLGDDFGGMVALAVSLHAADDETRSALMPINRKHPLAELMRALADYPMPPRRRITIEYTLVAGRNDGLDEAKKLVRLLAGLPVKVNLIPMNPIALSSLGPPSNDRVLAFQETLVRAGLSCFLRRRRGDDVSAACGQLALLGAKPKVKGFRPSPEG
jgi:23S rRNA (adenine2503-C2)-methyltransferase